MLGFHALGEQALGATVQSGTAYTLTAEAGSYTLTGVAAALRQTSILAAGTGAFTLTGIDAALTYRRIISFAADPGSYTLTGIDADLFTFSFIEAETAAFVLTGQSLNTLVGYRLYADHLPARSENWTLFGPLGTLAMGQSDGAGANTTFAFIGQNAFIAAERSLTAAAGSYAVTPSDVFGLQEKPAVGGSYTYTGVDAGLAAVRFITADAATYTITASNIDFFQRRRMAFGRLSGGPSLGGKSSGGTVWRVAC